MNINTDAMREGADRAAQLLRAIGNPRRLLIFCHLAAGERSVGNLERLLGLRQPVLSRHLALLRRDDLVQTRRESRMIFYSLAGDEARRVLQLLYDMYCRQLTDGAPPSGVEP